MKAIILIKIQAGEIHHAVRALRRLAPVLDAHMTLGPYDAIVYLETRDIDALGKLVAWDIQTIPGVRETRSLIMVEAELPDAADEAGQQEALYSHN